VTGSGEVGRPEDRAGRGRAAAVFAVAFVALLGLLVLRSRELFWRVIYEKGDLAANSIITYQAKHFDLLVGNYSRIGFSHPGPAYFYVQAAGEWLLHDALGLVPSPWNGQAVAIFAFNAACLALALTVVFAWFRSLVPVVAAGGAALAYLAANGEVVTSTWMPHAYTTPLLLLLVAAASVAAGRAGHLWLLVLAGGLLVHGHAEFLFFVPLIAGAALLAHWRQRRRGGAGVAGDHGHWLAATAVLAVFLLPIVLNLALHWPGEFGKYLTYGGGRGVHAPAEALRFQAQFWAADPWLALTVAVTLFAAVRLAAHCARGEAYAGLLLAGWRLTALGALLFFVYTGYGIDGLHETYVGYFSRAMPLALLMLAAAGWAALLPGLPGLRRLPELRGVPGLPGPAHRRTVPPGAVAPAFGAVVLAAGFVAAGLSPGLVNRRAEAPGVPHALEAMAARAAGRPMVLEIAPHDAWPEATSLVIGGVRRGHRVCVADPRWRVLVTAEFVCSGRDLADGERFVVSRPGQAPPGATVLADLHPSVVSLARR